MEVNCLLSDFHSSIRLSAPQEANESDLPFHRLAGILLSFALFLGFGGWLIATLSLPIHGWVPALAGLAVAVAVDRLSEHTHELFIGLLGSVVGSLLLWAVAFRYTRAGLALISNAVTRLLSIKNLQILAQYEVTLPEASHAMAVTLFVLPPALLLALLCTLAARSNLVIVPIGLLLFSFGIMLGVDCYLGAPWLLLLFLSMCLMLCQIHSPRRRTGALWLPLIGLSLMLLVVAVVSPRTQQALSDSYSAKKAALLSRFHASEYESVDLPLTEGDLAEATNFSPSSDEALTVTMDEPSSMYLRGFVGSVLEAGEWTSLSGEMRYEERALFYRLHAGGFYPQKQLSLLASAVGYDEEPSGVVIELDGACSAFSYAPYELTDAASSLLPSDGLDDTGLVGGLATRYTLAVTPGLAANYPKLAAMLNAQSDSPSEELSRYLAMEERYRRFVYDAYLTLDDDVKRTLANHLTEGAAIGETHLSYADAKDAIRTLLAQSISYSDTDATPFDGSGESLENLLDGGSGFSTQYATISALVFRYYGIPSRYVEGYLVTGSAAQEAVSGEPLTLTMENAHAWVEYYHDGIGWIPFEVTPGYLEETDVPPDTEEVDQPQDPVENPPTPDDDPIEPDEPEDPETGNLLAILLPILVVLLLIGAWFLMRYLVLQRRKEEFLQDDTNRAVAAIVGHLVRLLAAQGLTPPEGSLSSLTPELFEVRDRELALSYQRAVNLAAKAAYSGQVLTAAERDEALAVLDRWVADTEKRKNRAERLFLRYVLWLY
jgi:hypothetical protein